MNDSTADDLEAEKAQFFAKFYGIREEPRRTLGDLAVDYWQAILCVLCGFAIIGGWIVARATS
jgi:hypothetical protein